MAGKEDPARNFGAVGGGSAPAEQVEAEAEGIEVGVVASAFTPQPLAPSRHKREEKKAGLVYGGGLRPCSGSHTPIPTDEELQQREADFVSGGSLRACGSRRMLGEKEMEKEVLTGGKRKAEDSEAPPALGSAELKGDGVVAATSSDAPFAPAYGVSFVDEATGIEYIDIPENYLCWILSQKRVNPPRPYDPRKCPMMSPEEIEREVELVERLTASQAGVQDEFFEFQAWVRKTYETKGRVLVPVESIPEEFTSEE